MVKQGEQADMDRDRQTEKQTDRLLLLRNWCSPDLKMPLHSGLLYTSPGVVSHTPNIQLRSQESSLTVVFGFQRGSDGN